MAGANPQWLQHESRRCLQSLHQSNSISPAAWQHVTDALNAEWGPQQGYIQTETGPPQYEFEQLENHLRECVKMHVLSEGGLGTVYIILSQERAGKPVTGVPVEHHDQATGTHHRGLSSGKGSSTAKKYGQMVMDSAAHGFGFTLGADAANSLWHSLFK